MCNLKFAVTKNDINGIYKCIRDYIWKVCKGKVLKYQQLNINSNTLWLLKLYNLGLLISVFINWWDIENLFKIAWFLVLHYKKVYCELKF